MDATHKALILDMLAAGPKSGKFLQGQVSEPTEESRPGLLVRWFPGLRKIDGLVAFYTAMAKLEDEGVVEGYWVDGEIDGTVIRSRWYRLTVN